MTNQVKVKNTEKYEDSQGEHDVCRGKLILIPSKEKSVLYGVQNKVPNGKWLYFITESNRNSVLDEYHFIKPIIISEIEQQDSLTEGDKILFTDTEGKQEIYTYLSDNGYGMSVTQDGVNYILAYSQTAKILALPEHFSSKQLQAIADSKLKSGDEVLVKCVDANTYIGSFMDGKIIALNNKHIKLFPINHEESWDDIIKNHGAYFEVESGEDTERLDDFIYYLKNSYHPPKRK